MSANSVLNYVSSSQLSEEPKNDVFGEKMVSLFMTINSIPLEDVRRKRPKDPFLWVKYSILEPKTQEWYIVFKSEFSEHNDAIAWHRGAINGLYPVSITQILELGAKIDLSFKPQLLSNLNK